jgi:hypothetical protein
MPRHKILHQLNLLISIILPQRPFPNDLHIRAARFQFLLRLHRPRVDRLPKLMRRPLRNHRNRIGFVRRIRKKHTCGQENAGSKATKGIHVASIANFSSRSEAKKRSIKYNFCYPTPLATQSQLP